MRTTRLLGLLLLLGGCSFVFDPDAVPPPDALSPGADAGADSGSDAGDGTQGDAGTSDAGTSDAGLPDAGPQAVSILSFEAEPATVLPGGFVRLSWVTEHATGCTVNGSLPAPVPADSKVVVPAGNTTYTLRCEGEGGPVTREVAVTVKAAGSVVIHGFTASPETVLPGGTSLLSWSASNATGCTVSDGAGFEHPSSGGSGAVEVSPASTTEYTLTCTGSGAPASAARTVSVAEAEAVVITRFEASPNPIALGTSSTISWASANATGCLLQGASVGPSGTQPVTTPGATKTYTLVCTNGGGGEATATTTLWVSNQAVSIDSFTASPPNPVRKGEQVTLSWTSTNASSCRLEWNGESVAPGADASYSVELHVPTTFRLVCSRTDPVDADWEERTVTLKPVTVDVTPDTLALETGTTSQFAAAVEGAVTTGVGWSVREDGGGSVDENGLYTAPEVQETQTYHVVATSLADSAVSAEAVVTVHPKPVIDSFTASGTAPLLVGQTTTLSWQARHTTACTLRRLDDPDGITVGPTGTHDVTPLETTSYTLQCEGLGLPAVATVTAAYQPIEIRICPDRASILTDEPLRYRATVTGAVNTGVSWSLKNEGTDWSLGTDGLLVAPSAGSSLVVAVSEQDPSRSALAEVTVFARTREALSGTAFYAGPKQGPVYVTALNWPGATGAIPSGAPLGAGAPFRVRDVRQTPSQRFGIQIDQRHLTPKLSPEESFRFTASVQGPLGPELKWTVLEGPEGGTITADGMYTAPASCEKTYCIFHVMASSPDSRWHDLAALTVSVFGDAIPALPSLSPRETELERPGEVLFTYGANATWSVLDPGLGTLGGKGVYQAVKPGTNFVFATTPDGISAFGKVTLHDPGTLEVLAFMDVLGSGRYVASVDPAVLTTVTAYEPEGLQLTLLDPEATVPLPAVGCQAHPGPEGAVVLWDSARDPSNGRELASEYQVFASPDPAFTSDEGLPSVTAGGQNLVLPALAAGSYYFMVRSTNAAGLTDGPACGPVTVGPPASGNTISGQVDLGRDRPGATLLVFVGAESTSGPPSQIWFTRIPSPAALQNFTIEGVSAGSRMIGAFLDLDGDGAIGPLDPNTFRGDQPAQIQVDGNVEGQLLAFPLPETIARAVSEYRRQRLSEGVFDERYSVEVSAMPSGEVALRATLVGKLGQDGVFTPEEPSDLSGPSPRDGNPALIFRRSYDLGPVDPPPDRWVLNLEYADGRVCSAQTEPVALTKDFATLIDPVEDNLGVPLKPTFSWSLPAGLFGVRLELSVRRAFSSEPDLWTTDLPLSAVTVQYGGDLLGPGTYEWQVRLIDVDGNRTVSAAHFSIQ